MYLIRSWCHMSTECGYNSLYFANLNWAACLGVQLVTKIILHDVVVHGLPEVVVEVVVVTLFSCRAKVHTQSSHVSTFVG